MQQDLFENGLAVTPKLRNTLLQIAKWCKTLAIIAYSSLLLSFIVNLKDTDVIYTFLNLGVGVTLNTFLYLFANKLLIALNNNDEETFTKSFNNLRLYFLISGILTIIVAIALVVSLLWLVVFVNSVL